MFPKTLFNYCGFEKIGHIECTKFGWSLNWWSSTDSSQGKLDKESSIHFFNRIMRKFKEKDIKKVFVKVIEKENDK